MANAGYAAATIYIALSLVIAMLFAVLVIFAGPVFAILWLADHHLIAPFVH